MTYPVYFDSVVLFMKKLIRYCALLILLPCSSVYAIESFVIEKIQVEGLQRVTAGAVFVALPVKVGDEMNDQHSAASIQALYATGLFDDVQLRREGNHLVIAVVERPTIASTTFYGNKKIPSEIIEQNLKFGGLSAGGIYNPGNVDNFISEIRQAYVEIGHFSVEITTTVEPLERNRVNLAFNIFEGKIALIKEIRIVGNEKISDKDIRDIMKVTAKKTFGFLNRNNRYNRAKLRADLENIVSHYHNLGHLDFEILSSRSFLAEDRQSILVVISMSEGSPFKFGEIQVRSSDDVIPQEQLDMLVEEKTGELYSFEQVSQTRSRISNEFANQGFARTQVDPLPTIHEDEQVIDVNYVVKPGKLTYVRRITFTGNTVTNDEVLRREMRIYEGGVYSAQQIQQSRNRLGRLGIFTNVDMHIEPVPRVEDQIDIFVEVEESLTGSILFGIGYSEADQVLLNFNISQRNLFGTGKQASIDTNFSKVQKLLSVDYTNPYYTLDGVSRGFNFQYQDTDTSESNTSSIYDLGLTGLGMDYLIPVTEEGSFGIGLSAEQYKLTVEEDNLRDDFIQKFAVDNPKGTSGKILLSYRKDTRNRALFVSSGSEFSLSTEFSAGDLEYNIFRARYARFFPLGKTTTLKLSSQLDYGDDSMPFFRNFYMSGSATIRGFDSSSLGAKEICSTSSNMNAPEYSVCNNSRSLGGNLRLLNRAELYLPFFGAKDSDDKRFSVFLDWGNTFINSNSEYSKIGRNIGAHEAPSFGNLRASTGLAFEWLSPIGPFGISFGIPIKKKDGDRLDRFQITLGYFQ
jgi:outer membrane protein insertion porin family